MDHAPFNGAKVKLAWAPEPSATTTALLVLLTLELGTVPLSKRMICAPL